MKSYLVGSFGDESLGLGGRLLSEVFDLDIWDPEQFDDRLLTLFLSSNMRTKLRFLVRDDKVVYNQVHEQWKREPPKKVFCV